ncbi:MAG: CocE/NonD family hydrolase, partial [Acidobacteriota bacterium]|nr:CocE/NonD family hydrolase [Acidobacteriota bacterium]
MKYLRRTASGLALLAFLSLVGLQLPHSVLAQDAQQQPVEVKINPQTFDQLVGQYQDPEDPDFILSFFREGDKFYVQPTDQRKTEIFSASESRFFIKNANVQVDFIRDASGRTASTILHANGKEYRYQRISDQPAKQAPVVPFTRTEAMIPMRDGVHLHTIILAPQTQGGPLPIIMDRTPYGVDGWNSEVVNSAHRELVADGYVFVFQDIRGKFKSEGEFVMLRPPRDRR